MRITIRALAQGLVVNQIKESIITISKETLKRIEALVALNDHSGAYQLAAQTLGCNDLAERFAGINRQHQELGHLPTRLYEERYGVYQELVAFARANLCDTDFQRLYAAF